MIVRSDLPAPVAVQLYFQSLFKRWARPIEMTKLVTRRLQLAGDHIVFAGLRSPIVNQLLRSGYPFLLFATERILSFLATFGYWKRNVK
jgi:hypothetical protein